MTCPRLEYRSEDGEHSFDEARPYCTIKEEFVSPMHADICNDRFDFHHTNECDVYRQFVKPADAD